MHKAIERVAIDGMFLEFGVFKGSSIRRIRAEMLLRGIDNPVCGFDSFHGLPEHWTADYHAGHFALEKIPVFDDAKIIIVAGMFQDTLAPFLENHQGPAAFVHVDCDLYSSTSYILKTLHPRIVPGTVIIFDEMIGYADYANHEYRAFVEYLSRHDRQATVLCHGPKQVAIQMKK